MAENTQSSDRLDRIEAALARLTERHEALTERHEALTERHEALTMNLELVSRELERLNTLAERDGEHIRQLAHNAVALHESIKSLEAIVVSHEQRLDDIERQS